MHHCYFTLLGYTYAAKYQADQINFVIKRKIKTNLITQLQRICLDSEVLPTGRSENILKKQKNLV